MRFFQRRTGTALLTGTAAALLAAGCGGSGGTGSPSPAKNTGAVASAASSAGAGIDVKTVEKDYSINLSMTKFTPGVYTFDISNQGAFPHNLNVKGPGVDGQVSSTLQAGAEGKLTVALQQGSYELWCSIDGHKDRGMDMTIQVSP